MPYSDAEKDKAYHKEYRHKNSIKAKIYMSEWRAKNGHKAVAYFSKWETEVRSVNHKNVLEYLAAHPCVDCGEKDPIVLQFDHIKPEEKKNSVARLIDGSHWDNVLAEIEKCRVVCANCHTRRTAKQFGWWKAKGALVGGL
jgi:hypothetical protein